MAKVKDNYVGDGALLGNYMQTYEITDPFKSKEASPIEKWHKKMQAKLAEFDECGYDLVQHRWETHDMDSMGGY